MCIQSEPNKREAEKNIDRNIACSANKTIRACEFKVKSAHKHRGNEQHRGNEHTEARMLSWWSSFFPKNRVFPELFTSNCGMTFFSIPQLLVSNCGIFCSTVAYKQLWNDFFSIPQLLVSNCGVIFSTVAYKQLWKEIFFSSTVAYKQLWK